MKGLRYETIEQFFAYQWIKEKFYTDMLDLSIKDKSTIKLIDKDGNVMMVHYGGKGITYKIIKKKGDVIHGSLQKQK